MSSIPDGLSFAQLQELMKDAEPEPTKDDNSVKVLSKDKIKELIVEHTGIVHDEIGDVSAFKHLAMYSLMHLLAFHNHAAIEHMEKAESDEDREIALAWGRDAGWIQSCLNTLHDVSCGPNDWFTAADDDDDDED